MPISRTSWLPSILNILLPPRCFGCGAVVSTLQTLCPPCWTKCTFLSPPWCILCGWPFPYETPEQTVCLPCLHRPPLFVQSRSALVYNEGCRSFILKLKHGDGTHLTPALGNLMLRVGEDILAETDFLIPVPLHWRRLSWRQYNQATLLSRQISRHTGIPTYTNLIRRHRSTCPQGHQSRKDRYANIRGAFHVPKGQAPFLHQKRLTLIDDVFTTGATLTECARTLLIAGAKEIRVLTLARVIVALE